jgi:sigma-B regulation protein RsbU (phosphoserine phosphatase)
MPAALMTPVLHSLVRGIGVAKDQPLAELVRTIGETFSRLCPDGCYATLFIGAIDAAQGRLRYVNAGHEPPLVVRSAAHRKRTLLLEATGPMLGLLRRVRYHERACMLAPGDVLVAMTDGVCDAESSGGQVWGRDRLLQVIQRCDDSPARAVVEEIFSELDRATRGTTVQDDMTLWLGRLKGEAQKPRLLADHIREEEPQNESLVQRAMVALA